jgi:hypothetical protein
MTTTLDAFANQMADEAGEDYTDAQVALLFKQWSKEAFVNTAASSRFLWTNAAFDLTTSIGVSEYTLDATVAEVKALRNKTTEALLGYNTEESLIRLNIDFEESAAPKYWFYSGIDTTSTAFKVQLVPVPDAVYNLQIRALTRPTDLGDSTVIPLPVEFVELLRMFVRAMYQHNDDKIQLAQQNLQVYQQTLLAYVTRYTAPRQVQSGLRVKNIAGNNQAPAASVT